MANDFDFLLSANSSGPAATASPGIYELRTYDLMPGKLLEWADNWWVFKKQLALKFAKYFLVGKLAWKLGLRNPS